MKFKDLLSSDSNLLKQALEGPDNTQFENDFGQIAYPFLQDRAPQLIPYLIGFEVVERDEDGSRAVGLFGFKLGEELYYVPVFFANNQVKGVDLLFSKKTNLFVPLRETWVNHILNRQSISLGGGVNESVRQDFDNPDFRDVLTPPNNMNGVNGYQKMGSDLSLDGFRRSCYDVWNKVQKDVVQYYEKDAEFQKAFAATLLKLSKESPVLEKTAEGSKLIEFMQKAGGPKSVGALLGFLTSDVKLANAALTFYPTLETLAVTQFDASLAPKQSTHVEVVSELKEWMGDEYKSKLVRDGFTIKDSRKEEDKSEIFDSNYATNLENPTCSGTYKLLMADGTRKPVWVLSVVLQRRGKSEVSKYLVVNPTDSRAFIADAGALLVDGTGEVMAKKEPFDAAIKLSDMEIGKTYALINDANEVSHPFIVRTIVSEDGERVRLGIDSYVNDLPEYMEEKPQAGDFDKLDYRGGYPCCGSSGSSLHFVSKKSNKLSLTNGVIAVPSNFKALEIGVSGKDSAETKSESYEVREARRNAEREAFKPGSSADLSAALLKEAVHSITVGSDDGLEYYIVMDGGVTAQRMGYKTAMVTLVTKYAMDQEDARIMILEANSSYKSNRLIKLGQFVGVNMPQIQEDPGSPTDYYGAPQMFQPQEDIATGQMQGVPPLQETEDPNFAMGGEAETQAMGGAGGDVGMVAQEAAGLGQQQVFDHAAIGGLARLYDTNAVIDTYIPDMVKAMDRLGRILFLYYWKNKEFADRYGTEDLADLEDSLRGVFKSFGDIILKLKEKSVDTTIGDNPTVM